MRVGCLRVTAFWRLVLAMLGAAVPVALPAAEPAEGAAYAPVLPGRQLVLPADGGAHDAHRTEWWYVTGWVEDEQRRARGFQITFFRVRTLIGEDNPSRFAPSQLLLAHAALADPAHGRLRHAERAARALPPLAGYADTHTEVWIGDWSLRWDGERYLSRAFGEDFAFELAFRPTVAPLFNGEQGFSQKAADPAHASYYYSRPQLAVDGTVHVAGEELAVSGSGWLDHEWSSAIMPPGAQGWDWLGINLADGGALMAFQMRAEDGHALWAAGTLRASDGVQHRLGADEVRFQPLRYWRSPRTGNRYPVAWRVEIAAAQGRAARVVEVEPLMDDQELDSRRSTGAVYWEGAVRLLEEGREIGRGYLEMTGYGERLRM